MRLVILQVPGPRGIWQGNLVLAIFAGIVWQKKMLGWIEDVDCPKGYGSYAPGEW